MFSYCSLAIGILQHGVLSALFSTFVTWKNIKDNVEWEKDVKIHVLRWTILDLGLDRLATYYSVKTETKTEICDM